jgi:hypothetical protein
MNLRAVQPADHAIFPGRDFDVNAPFNAGISVLGDHGVQP